MLIRAYTTNTSLHSMHPTYISSGIVLKSPPAMQTMQVFNPWVWQIPCRREWLPTPIPLPGEFHGQKSLMGYSP